MSLTIRHFLSLAILLFALASKSFTVAQEVSAEAQSNILVEIPKYLEQTNQLNSQIDELSSLPESVQLIAPIIDTPDEELINEHNSLMDSSLTLSLTQLENQHAYWSGRESEVTKHNTTLAEYIQKLQLKSDEIRLALAKWDSTAQLALNQNAPREIISVIENAKIELSTKSEMIENVQNEALSIQASITTRLSMINEVKLQLTKRKNKLLTSIWIRDSPALWNFQIDSSNLTIAETLVVETILVEESLINFLRVHQDFTIAFIAILISLLSYIFYIRTTHTSEIEDYSEDLNINLLISRPIIVAIFMTMILTFLFFQAPDPIRRLYGLMNILPTSLLIYAYVKNLKWQTSLVYVSIAGFYQFTALTSSNQYSRYFFLIQSIILAAAILLALRNKKNKENTVIPLVQHPVIGSILFILLLEIIASILFNLSGHFVLSKLLVIGAVSSVIGSIVFFIGANLLLGLISLILLVTLRDKSNIVKYYHTLIIGRIRRILLFSTIVTWLYYSLGAFRILDFVVTGLTTFITREFGVGELRLSLADILAFIITIQISIWISQFIRFILETEVYPRTDSSRRRAKGAILLMIKYSFNALGVLLAFAAAGIKLSSLTVVLGALGVGIGFGLQNIFNNLISGILLAVERPMQIGDIVEVDGLMGEVTQIGFRASTLRTYDGSEVIVPNGDLVSNKLTNWTLSDKKRRLKVHIKTTYETDPDLVLATLKKAAETDTAVLKDPAPFARFLGFGESYLEFQLLYWIPDFDNSFSMGTKITTAVYTALRDEGIEVAIPKQEILIDPPQELITPADKKVS